MTLDKPRLLMVGLDAFPPSLLEQWCDDGTMPNMAALRKESRYGHVKSVARYLPGSTWPTFNAGLMPSEHGIYHFMQWDPDDMMYRRPAPDWIDYTAFWHRLGRQGTRIVAFDVPFCYPKREPNVVEAHGWGLHDELAPAYSNPQELIQELRTKWDNKIKPDVLGPRALSVLQKQLDDLIDSINMRIDVIEELAARHEWDLFLTVFPETHRAGHYFWGDRVTGEEHGGLKRVAKAFDAVLPRLRKLAPDSRLAMFSLHGMGPTADIERFSDDLSAYFVPQVMSAGRRFDPIALLHRHTPQKLRRTLSATLSTRMRDRLFSHYLGAGQDWSKIETIFVPPDVNLTVRANVIGRERDGILPASEAEAHLQKVGETLMQMKTASGVQAIDEIGVMREIYGEGARADLLPDIVARPHLPLDGDVLKMPDGQEIRVASRDGRDGTHNEMGFYIQAGLGIDGTGETIDESDLAQLLCDAAGLHFDINA